MLFDSLIKYLSEVEATVRQAEGAYVERYEEEIVAADRVNLRIRVRFQKGHMLELNEAVISEAGRPTSWLSLSFSGRAEQACLSI